MRKGSRGSDTSSSLPVGCHRVRVARSTDGLFGPRAAVAVVEVKEGVETRAYLQLPPP